MVNWKTKSPGKRLMFRLTALFKLALLPRRLALDRHRASLCDLEPIRSISQLRMKTRHRFWVPWRWRTLRQVPAKGQGSGRGLGFRFGVADNTEYCSPFKRASPEPTRRVKQFNRFAQFKSFNGFKKTGKLHVLRILKTSK